MSKLRVNRIENTSSTDGGIDIDSSGHVQIDGVQLPNAGASSHRNLVINGAMTISQRSTSVTGISNSDYRTCDRYRIGIWRLGTWSISQDTDAPSGFSHSLKLMCSVADSSPSTDDFLYIKYHAEAQDLQHLNYGTSDAKELTLSFWVKSNKTGNASVRINAPDGTRDFVKAYNIASANTWEYKTITIPADTAGTINNDNGVGLSIGWWLNSGPDLRSATPSAGWAATNLAAVNNSNLGVGGAVDDYFQLTGVQLELGSKATSFEHHSYSDELRRCQRYYQIVAKATSITNQASLGTFTYWGANTLYGAIRFPIEMRAAPSFEQNTGTAYYISYSAGASQSGSSLSMFTNKSTRTIEFFITLTSNGVTGRSSIFRTNNANAHVALTSELL